MPVRNIHNNFGLISRLSVPASRCFGTGVRAVIKGRMTDSKAYLACMKDGEEQPEDPPPEPEVIDVIEHKFDPPRDAESELRRRSRRER